MPESPLEISRLCPCRTETCTTMLSAVAAAALVLGSALSATTHASAQRVTPPPTPTQITPPVGNSAFLVGHAFGTQGYTCLPTSTEATSWAINRLLANITFVQRLNTKVDPLLRPPALSVRPSLSPTPPTTTSSGRLNNVRFRPGSSGCHAERRQIQLLRVKGRGTRLRPGFRRPSHGYLPVHQQKKREG
jgi:hypothetical protein